MISYSMLKISCTVLLYIMYMRRKPVILFPAGNPMANSKPADQIYYADIEISTFERRFCSF